MTIPSPPHGIELEFMRNGLTPFWKSISESAYATPPRHYENMAQQNTTPYALKGIELNEQPDFTEVYKSVLPKLPEDRNFNQLG
jgi:hypothetical protein